MANMEKKIYKNISIISILISVLTSILVTIIFYNFYITREKNNIKELGNIISSNININAYKRNDKRKEKDYRITLINLDGDVIYDSYNNKFLDNHINRPEIKEALLNKTSEVIRYSKTMDKDSYYYAIYNNNGIIRISKDLDSIYFTFLKILPYNIIIIIFILLITIYISRKYTSKIIEPINKMTANIENIILYNNYRFNNKEYEELLPFIKKIQNLTKELKNKNDLLTKNVYLINNIIDNMEEGLIYLNNNKEILLYNKSSKYLLGVYGGNTYINKKILFFSRNLKLNKKLEQAIETEKNISFILNINKKTLRIYISNVFLEKKRIGMVIFILDISEKVINEKLRREFTANVSHELKTPLTSILGYSELMSLNIVEKKNIPIFSKKIYKESKRLLYLIDNIIKLSKLDENRGIKIIEIDLIQVLNNIKNRYINDINIKIEAAKKIVIYGDCILIEELFINLIDNSIKHGFAENIYIKLLDDHSQYIICYIDDGLGIDKKDQDRIFERFYMGDKSRNSNTKNSGLGLSIVKHILKRHKGKIVLDKNYKKGAKFNIYINKS